MPAHIAPYGQTDAGEAVHRITLADAISLDVLTYGGILARIAVGGVNVALGLDSLDGYAHRSPHFGAATGRYAGRIANARFTLDGTEYHLPQNEGPNCLHGGPHALDKRVWTIEHADATTLTLAYSSPDGDDGFPGALQTRITYTVEGATLRLAYEATSDRPTVLNLTNHSYFNLAGEGSGDVFAHTLQVDAAAVLETDAQSIPTGARLAVEGTPFDFRTPHPIGARLRIPHPQMLLARGYDQCFVLDGAGFRRAASLAHPPSGRALEVWTDQPAIQVYSGNKLTGALVGPSGRIYRSGDGVALETQHFPDSPNHPAFPTTTLRPGDVFRSTTEYRFTPAA